MSIFKALNTYCQRSFQQAYITSCFCWHFERIFPSMPSFQHEVYSSSSIFANWIVSTKIQRELDQISTSDHVTFLNIRFQWLPMALRTEVTLPRMAHKIFDDMVLIVSPPFSSVGSQPIPGKKLVVVPQTIHLSSLFYLSSLLCLSFYFQWKNWLQPQSQYCINPLHDPFPYKIQVFFLFLR